MWYKLDGLMAKWKFMQQIFILFDFLSEKFIRYNFIHIHFNLSIRNNFVDRLNDICKAIYPLPPFLERGIIITINKKCRLIHMPPYLDL